MAPALTHQVHITVIGINYKPILLQIFNLSFSAPLLGVDLIALNIYPKDTVQIFMFMVAYDTMEFTISPSEQTTRPRIQ